MPNRVQLRRAKGWRMPPNTVKVARPGPWGNPFVIGRDGDRETCLRLFGLLAAGYTCVSKDEPCYQAQKRWLRHALKHLSELRGKNLACWCRLDQKCHADFLLLWANKQTRPINLQVNHTSRAPRGAREKEAYRP